MPNERTFILPIRAEDRQRKLAVGSLTGPCSRTLGMRHWEHTKVKSGGYTILASSIMSNLRHLVNCLVRLTRSEKENTVKSIKTRMNNWSILLFGSFSSQRQNK